MPITVAEFAEFLEQDANLLILGKPTEKSLNYETGLGRT
jgi:hypothetical protein